MLQGPHAQVVAQVAGEFVPLAEAIFPMLRKPLASELSQHLGAIEKNLKVDVKSVLSLYGFTLDDRQVVALKTLEEDARRRSLDGFKALIDSLERDRSLSIAGFVQALMKDLIEAMEKHGEYSGHTNAHWKASGGRGGTTDALAKELDVPAADLETMVRGDTSFRGLLAFLDHARGVIKKVEPRSIIDARSS